MDLLSEIVRVSTVLQACFVLGVTAVSIYAYRNRPLISHIAFVATSYCLLTAAVVHSLYVEAYPRTGVKALIVLTAFGLGDYALIKILRRHANGKSGEMPTAYWIEMITQIVETRMEPTRLTLSRIEEKLNRMS